jgi:hypothetical protein
MAHPTGYVTCPFEVSWTDRRAHPTGATLRAHPTG